MKGTKEFNIPIIRANRELVASTDGGLHYPSVLVFSADWGITNGQEQASKKFKYPYCLRCGIKMPQNEEDVAFMDVSLYFLS